MTFDYFSKNRVTYILTKLKTILDSKAVPNDIKNGKLTIQKNGTNVQTFTANQSSNATANITVPTKTSDLTNDSGFITNAGVTGAKGNSETNYRTGNVNITAANIGLGNVGNFKAVSTVASQDLTDTEKSNARANIGAGTSNFSGAYADLTGKPTIPTVNNATLTIQKNGTNVQTFTANQASNATANITVPTKVSELTNDSGYTTNVGTITGIKMNGASKGTSGVVDLGTVITAHQDISGKANTADLGDGAYKNSGVYYGTCATAAATKDKVVSVSTDQKFTLKVGAVVHVKFTNSNSYSATVDNKITLNVNSTGAKNIYYGTGYPTGTNTTAFGAANYIMSYMYNGTDWVWVGFSGENNTTYSAMSSSELTTGTATSSRTVRADYLKTGINSLIDTKINALDVTGDSAVAASKTISAWSETNGKVSISTQDISITKSQVSDLPATIGTITGIKMNGASKGTSGVVDLGTVITAHQDISGKADKSATVSTVAWDSTNKKITKTINGTTSDVVTAATILGNLTKAQVTTALGYTPPTSDTNTHRPIRVNDTEILGNNTTALNLKAGTNVSLNNSSGTVTIAATNTLDSAGSTDTSSKIFLIGTTSQKAYATTYSDDQVYTTSGTLTSNKLSTKALTALTGSGTAGSDKGSGVSPRYIPTKWTFNSGITVANGEVYLIKIPTAGGTYGVWLSLNNGTNYYPVAVSSSTGRFTTHYGVDTVIAVTYESAGKCNCYALAGADATASVTGIFRVLNDYDANTTYSAMSSSELTTGTVTTSRVVRSDYLKTGINSLIDAKLKIPSAYCDTAAGTAAKVASCTGYNLLNNSYIQVIIVNTNTYAGAITLNINGKGAKPIYINEAASSSSNYALMAGSYLVFYYDSKYYFRTDGRIPGHITGLSSGLRNPRSNTDANNLLTESNPDTLTVDEISNGASNIPSSHYYHIISSQGADTAYQCQLALGMTVEGVFYRTKNNNTWTAWNLLGGRLISKSYTINFSGASNTGTIYARKYGRMVELYVSWTSSVPSANTRYQLCTLDAVFAPLIGAARTLGPCIELWGIYGYNVYQVDNNVVNFSTTRINYTERHIGITYIGNNTNTL